VPIEHDLNPLERRVLRLVDQGMPDDEIGRRFRRSPQFATRVATLARVPRPPRPRRHRLRPVERRVLKWRERGVDHAEIGRRFRRGPGHVAQIERLARYKAEAHSGSAGG